jgi:hypothetical protein
MPILTTGGFFQEFNFDTLLALISCIAGVVALFLGGAAYKNCKIIKDSFNEKKEFEDNSQDHSQRAAGDIINNNGISDTQLVTITTALTTMNSTNFSEALDKAYTRFQEQCDENLKNIIDQTKQVIADNRLQISGYTKIDWIHIYLESAKNASDAYMQNVWAKVLARELAQPDSFSYKTLDVLKNMSANDFRLFEKACAICMDDLIISDRKFNAYLSWMKKNKLSELGLLSLSETERTYTVSANGKTNILVAADTLAIFLRNESDAEVATKFTGHLFTNSARELMRVAAPMPERQFFLDCGKDLKEKCTKPIKLTLHDVTWFDGMRFNYQQKDLLE